MTNGPAAALWHAPGFLPGIVTASQSAGGAWSWSGASVSISDLTEPSDPIPKSVVGNVDGDGLADGVSFRDVFSTVPSSFPPSWKQNGETTAISLGAFVTSLFPGIGVTPSLRVRSCFGPSPQMVTSMDWDLRDAAASLVDMNGDGLGDLAFITKEQKFDGRTFLGVRYWPGDGRGNFTACTGDACLCTANGSKPRVSNSHRSRSRLSSRRRSLPTKWRSPTSMETASPISWSPRPTQSTSIGTTTANPGAALQSRRFRSQCRRSRCTGRRTGRRASSSPT